LVVLVAKSLSSRYDPLESSGTGLKDTVLEEFPQDRNRDFNPVFGLSNFYEALVIFL